MTELQVASSIGRGGSSFLRANWAWAAVAISARATASAQRKFAVRNIGWFSSRGNALSHTFSACRPIFPGFRHTVLYGIQLLERPATRPVVFRYAAGVRPMWRLNVRV